MQYQNDESDKNLRKRNYYLTVFVLPIVVSGVVAIIFYVLTTKSMIQKYDSIMGYITCLIIFMLLNRHFASKWLSLSNSEFIYISSLPNTKTNIEPKIYLKEYHDSVFKKVFYVVTAFSFFALAYFVYIKTTMSIIYPILLILIGISSSIYSIKNIFENKSYFKIAKNGIWTKKLGFVEWSKVTKIEYDVYFGRYSYSKIHIYLKGTMYEKANRADDTINFDYWKKKEIQTTIKSIQKRTKI